MSQFDKLENESELQYIWRICSNKDAGVIDKTWEELADILNKNLRDDDEHWTSSAYRKKYQQAKLFNDEVFSKMENSEFYKELSDQRRELERLKIQYRDERNAWNKQNYIDARVEQKLDYLESVMSESGRIYFPNHDNTNIYTSDNDMLIMLSDLHIGQTFNSRWGEYNTDVAKLRIGEYLTNIREIASRHKCQNAYVSILGDLVSGSIHKTLQVTNRENVIDQIKIASDIITSFIYELSNMFEAVMVTNVSGNHSRIDKKDEALHDERLDDLIQWTVMTRLSGVDNIFFCKTSQNIDTGISLIEIRGKNYIGVHGDFDAYSKNGVANLSMMLGFIPDVILYGHLHSPAFSEVNGVKIVRGGSLAGSGDQYTIEKRLCGKPSQTVCICSNKGIIAHYPIEL